jgi:thioredoxin-dependent adenylylsulfate APS reductase
MSVQAGWTAERVAEAGVRLAQASPAEVLAWALDAHAPAIALGTGLGAEGMVLLDQLARMGRLPRVFMLDTGRLHQETYDLLDRVRERYRVTIEIFAPAPADLEPMVRAHGPNPFYRSVELRRLCCHARKVLPLRRALAGLTAWITGLRRDGTTRAAVAKLEVDLPNGGLVKVNPLADWSADEVWRYIRAHKVPYNTLHDRGFPSIGCAPCTRAVAPGEDPRAGRWWWERPEHRECGIHLAPAPRSTARASAPAVGVG